MIIDFRRYDHDKHVVQRPQRHKSFLVVAKATVLESHRLARLDHLCRVRHVEAVLLEVARLLCRIEAAAHVHSMRINVCIFKSDATGSDSRTMRLIQGRVFGWVYPPLYPLNCRIIATVSSAPMPAATKLRCSSDTAPVSGNGRR